MNKKILMSLVVLGCVSSLSANDTVDWDKEEKLEVQLKQKKDELRKLIVSTNMLMAEAIVKAEETIESLNKNLEFFKRIQSSQEYRECVVIEKYISDIDKDKSIADELYKEKKATKRQYTIYVSKLNATRQSLEEKINQKKCK